MTKIENKRTVKYTFKIGEKYPLDDMYNIQGLALGDWWEIEIRSYEY